MPRILGRLPGTAARQAPSRQFPPASRRLPHPPSAGSRPSRGDRSCSTLDWTSSWRRARPRRPAPRGARRCSLLPKTFFYRPVATSPTRKAETGRARALLHLARRRANWPRRGRRMTPAAGGSPQIRRVAAPWPELLPLPPSPPIPLVRHPPDASNPNLLLHSMRPPWPPQPAVHPANRRHLGDLVGS